MNIGYVREIPRLAVGTQIKSLNKVDCYRIWNAGHAESLKECIESLRDNETLAVCRIAVLTAPEAGRSSKSDRPRNRLREYMKMLAGKNAPILETATNRRFVPDDSAIDAIFDAVDHWSGNSGKQSPGRPKLHDYSADEWKVIEGIWRDPVHKNNAARVFAVRDHDSKFGQFTQAVWYEHTR